MKSSDNEHSRRKFIKQSLITGTSLVALGSASAMFPSAGVSDVPVILGGSSLWPEDKKPSWVKWPIWMPEKDEPGVLNVLRSGTWSRAGVVKEFEEKWAEVIGSKRCLTTVNGTNALICALANLDIGAGDEVILPVYTFIATPLAILQTGAMPVFVDTDPNTFQMDPEKIEAKITPRTRAILPVHIAGLPSDMERIMKIAKKHNLVVVEDACQAWLSEINGKKVGTFGDAGCFSFQNSKNIPMGEGGAIVSDSDEFIDRCFSYHNLGIAHGSMVDKHGAGFSMMGTKLRLTEYQAAIGLALLKRLQQQTDVRAENAAYLKSKLEAIPGIVPYKPYENVTKISFHLFPFRFKKESFNGMSKALFIKALAAEGIPCSPGYSTLNDKPYLKNAFNSKNFKRMYSSDELNFDAFIERNRCPQNDILCNEEGAWFTQNLLLGSRQDMDYIASAFERIQKNSADIKRKLGTA